MGQKIVFGKVFVEDVSNTKRLIMLKKTMALTVVFLSFLACQKKETVSEADSVTKDSLQTTEQIQGDGHHAQNSLDWQGTYEGTLPCADCPGIQTTITLSDANTFTLTSEYLERNTTIEDKGELMWHDNGSVIHLKGKETDVKLKVGENQLIYLDQDGNEIDGPLKEHYVLKKK